MFTQTPLLVAVYFLTKGVCSLVKENRHFLFCLYNYAKNTNFLLPNNKKSGII